MVSTTSVLSMNIVYVILFFLCSYTVIMILGCLFILSFIFFFRNIKLFNYYYSWQLLTIFKSMYLSIKDFYIYLGYIINFNTYFRWNYLFYIHPNTMFNLLYTNPQLIFQKPWIFVRIPLFFSYKLNNELIKIYTITNFIIMYNFFKSTIITILVAFLYFIYMALFFKISFLKQLSIWFIIGMLAFWLFSGFNFFLKRYQFGKFTSQIQRFWKRTNTCFWLIEGFLILLFFYYYLNSSQEPVYMYDYSSLNQEFTVSLTTILYNIILLSLIIFFMYVTLLKINSNNWFQLVPLLMIISSFIFFSFFIETYQFYYVLNTFNERVWLLNEEENLWSLEIDNPILRTKHQYLLVCLIAKYWHFLFIFLSWVFFLIKSFERKKVTFVLFGANLQNFIILYGLNFLCYIQWFKWMYRRFFDLPYTWFMTNIDTKFFFRFFLELKLILLNFINFNFFNISSINIITKSLTLWETNSLVLWKFI